MRALTIASLAALAFAGAGQAQAPMKPATLNSQLTGDLSVHDPVIIREGDTYYVFSTVGRYTRIHGS